MFKEVIYPEFLGSFNKTLFSTNFIFDIYQKVWPGGIIAGDIYGQFNKKNTPWPLPSSCILRVTMLITPPIALDP